MRRTVVVPFVRRRGLAALFAIGILALSLTETAAWGPAGHEAVALVAAPRLTPVTQRQVAALLAGQSIADVATWADEIAQIRRETAPWHFTNIPVTSTGFSRTRDCAQGRCVVGAIEQQQAILRDMSRSKLARVEALKFLVHFVGDIHQPLHAVDSNDRGGNQRSIVAMGRVDSLHRAWDSGILQLRGERSRDLVAEANRWLRTQTESRLTGGSAADWANESFRLARDVVYPQLKGDNTISHDEGLQDIRIIEERIARAGVRLAALLNRAFESRPDESKSE